jgi:hypothetical protein
MTKYVRAVGWMFVNGGIEVPSTAHVTKKQVIDDAVKSFKKPWRTE